MYANKKVDNTLDPNFMTSFHKIAQIAEFKELIKLISSQFLKTKRQLKILDIGVGDGRIPLALSGNGVWEKIDLFVGIENSQMEAQSAIKTIQESKLDHKVKVISFDALNLESKKFGLPEQKYDLIICTYFTPGNFKPDEIKIETDKNNKITSYPKESLNPNRNFIKVFKSAYEMLGENGKLFLGSVYIDTDVNRKRQEKFYKKCGMTLITSKEDEFCATKEGFWSEKFTRDKIYKCFYWVNKRNIKFSPLDNYNFAESIIISE